MRDEKWFVTPDLIEQGVKECSNAECLFQHKLLERDKRRLAVLMMLPPSTDAFYINRVQGVGFKMGGRHFWLDGIEGEKRCPKHGY